MVARLKDIDQTIQSPTAAGDVEAQMTALGTVLANLQQQLEAIKVPPPRIVHDDVKLGAVAIRTLQGEQRIPKRNTGRRGNVRGHGHFAECVLRVVGIMAATKAAPLSRAQRSRPAALPKLASSGGDQTGNRTQPQAPRPTMCRCPTINWTRSSMSFPTSPATWSRNRRPNVRPRPPTGSSTPSLFDEAHRRRARRRSPTHFTELMLRNRVCAQPRSAAATRAVHRRRPIAEGCLNVGLGRGFTHDEFGRQTAGTRARPLLSRNATHGLIGPRRHALQRLPYRGQWRVQHRCRCRGRRTRPQIRRAGYPAPACG